MPEIRFYHTQYKTAQEVLPDLLLKALSRQMRVVCKLADTATCQDYDDYLWQFSKNHFLPHGLATDSDAALQPVLLTDTDTALNLAKTMMVLDNAALPSATDYDLICLIFDGRNPMHVQHARGQWALLKDQANIILTYWQQQENGQWQSKS